MEVTARRFDQYALFVFTCLLFTRCSLSHVYCLLNVYLDSKRGTWFLSVSSSVKRLSPQKTLKKQVLWAISRKQKTNSHIIFMFGVSICCRCFHHFTGYFGTFWFSLEHRMFFHSWNSFYPPTFGFYQKSFSGSCKKVHVIIATKPLYTEQQKKRKLNLRCLIE